MGQKAYGNKREEVLQRSHLVRNPRKKIYPGEICMSVRDDFTVNLEEEILSEAAHTFFSKRVRLDREIEAFSHATGKVRKQMHKTLRAAEAMHQVVIEPEEFYATLGVEPKDLLREGPWKGALEPPAVPFGLTLKGKYVALGKALYKELAAETEKYNHGEIYKDPETTLMKRTDHYNELLEWHQELDTQIALQNEQLPTYSLQFVKSLNTELCEKEGIMESCVWVPHGSNIDQKLAFKGIPFSCTGLAEVPDLPPLRDVRTKLHGFLEETYDRHQGKIHDMLLNGRS
jgi:hypothetical protein